MPDPKIEFVCDPGLADVIPPPKPSGRFIPDWFKDMPRNMGMPDKHGLPAMTMRGCLPLTDAMSLGWTIPLPFDVWTSLDPEFGQLRFHWDETCPITPIERHHPGQVANDRPPFQGLQPFKFINPWRLKMPNGWSAMFVHPLNQFQLPFVTFAGAVDCDALEVPVNVPFFWIGAADVKLPAGTPIAQVVPYFRADLPKTATTK